jgi:hypothetical protein
MVGLMQVMIYLFCAYLIYKGFEIFQIALVSKPENESTRKNGIGLGILAIVFAFAIVAVALFLEESIVGSIGKNLPANMR